MHINYQVVGGLFDEICKDVMIAVNWFSFPCTKHKMMKSLVNKIRRYLWSQANCELISTSNLGFLFDVTNSIRDAIKIIIFVYKTTIQLLPFPFSPHWLQNYWIKEDGTFNDPWNFAIRNGWKNSQTS